MQNSSELGWVAGSGEQLNYALPALQGIVAATERGDRTIETV